MSVTSSFKRAEEDRTERTATRALLDPPQTARISRQTLSNPTSPTPQTPRTSLSLSLISSGGLGLPVSGRASYVVLLSSR